LTSQHWQLSGALNEAVKPGFVADHGRPPTMLTNDIFVFGAACVTAKASWQIKQFIGYVSTALQMEYRLVPAC